MHFDAYFNLHLQLIGRKRWVLYAPRALAVLDVYPLGHPSARQAILRRSAASALDGTGIQRIEVELAPGELLCVPPYWLHEVTVASLEPATSLNAFIDGPQQQLFERYAASSAPPRTHADLILRLRAAFEEVGCANLENNKNENNKKTAACAYALLQNGIR
eukprot:SAG31_NODE_17545_length_667_cov_0.744718_1_plen_160_part_10